MSDQTWLDALNDKQREAVTYRVDPLLVLAGPGSGKTRILTNRIAWMIREKRVQPENILAVTFTNRAAEEMRDRLFVILGEQASHVWVYTFHATAVRILRRFGEHIGLDPNFAIIDDVSIRPAPGSTDSPSTLPSASSSFPIPTSPCQRSRNTIRPTKETGTSGTSRSAE